MQSRERGGRRPGNEARCNLGECEVIFDIRMDAEEHLCWKYGKWVRIGATDGTGLECGVLSPRSVIMSRAWFRAH